MVMVGGVEIAVDLNLEGIEESLKELQKKLKNISFQVEGKYSSQLFSKSVKKEKSSQNNITKDLSKHFSSITQRVQAVDISIKTSTTSLKKEINTLSDDSKKNKTSLENTITKEIQLLGREIIKKTSTTEKNIVSTLIKNNNELSSSWQKGYLLLSNEGKKNNNILVKGISEVSTKNNNQLIVSIEKSNLTLSKEFKDSANKNIKSQKTKDTSSDLISKFKSVSNVLEKGQKELSSVYRKTSDDSSAKVSKQVKRSANYSFMREVPIAFTHKMIEDTFFSKKKSAGPGTEKNTVFPKIVSFLSKSEGLLQKVGLGGIPSNFSKVESTLKKYSSQASTVITSPEFSSNTEEIEQSIKEALSAFAKSKESGEEINLLLDAYKEGISQWFDSVKNKKTIDINTANKEMFALVSKIKEINLSFKNKGTNLSTAFLSLEKATEAIAESFSKSVSATRRKNIGSLVQSVQQRKEAVNSLQQEKKPGAVVFLPGFDAELGSETIKEVESLIDSKTQSFIIKNSPELGPDPSFQGEGLESRAVQYAYKAMNTDLLNYSSLTGEIVAEIIKTIEDNPDLQDIKLVGHSLGGAIAREVIEAIEAINLQSIIKENLGREINIEGISYGTASMGLASPNQFTEVLSRQDTVTQAGFGKRARVFEGYKDESASPGLVGHTTLEYLKDDILKSFLQKKIRETTKASQEKMSAELEKTLKAMNNTALQGIAFQLDIPQQNNKWKYLDAFALKSEKEMLNAIDSFNKREAMAPMDVDQATNLLNLLKEQASAISKELYGTTSLDEGGEEEQENAVDIIEKSENTIKAIKQIQKENKLSTPANKKLEGYILHLKGTIDRVGKMLPEGSLEDIRMKKQQGVLFDAIANVGQNVTEGLKVGVDIKQVEKVGVEVGEAIINSTKDTLGIQSPSKEFEEIGNETGAGLIKGLDSLDDASGILNKKMKEALEDSRLLAKKSLKASTDTNAIITPAPRPLAGLLPSSEMLKKAKEDYLMEWVSFLQDIETVRMRYDFETAWRKSNTTKLLPPAKESPKIKPLVTPAPKQITGLLPSVELANNLRAINETMQMISILQDTEMVRMRFDLDTNWSKGPSTKFLPSAEGFTPAGLLSGSLERKGIEDSLTKIYKEIIKLLPSIEQLQKEQEKSNIEYLIDFLKSTDIVQARFKLDQEWANTPNSNLSLPSRDALLAGYLPSSEMIEQRRLREKQLIQQKRESQRGIVSTAVELFPPEALNNLIAVSTQKLLPSTELRQKEEEIRLQSLREIADIARELKGVVEVLPFRNEAILATASKRANPLSFKEFSQDASAMTDPKLRLKKLKESLSEKGIDTEAFSTKTDSGFLSFSQQAKKIRDQVTHSAKIEEIFEPIKKEPLHQYLNVRQSLRSYEKAKKPTEIEEKINPLDKEIKFYAPPLLLAGIVSTVVSYKDELIKLGMESIEVAKRFEVLSTSFIYLSGGVESGITKLKEVQNLAREIGLDFETLAASYEQLAASTRNTSLEGETTDSLIKGVAQAGKAFGMSSEEIKGSILAISQIAGKGVVSAEELRGQLAERIPGAFQIAARAMKVTEKELFQLMATGQLTSADFLPKFGSQLQIETLTGISKASSLSSSAVNRLNNSIKELQKRIGEVLLPLYSMGVVLADFFVKILGDNLQSILTILGIGLVKLLKNSIPFSLLIVTISGYIKQLALSFGSFKVLVEMAFNGLKALFASLARILSVIAAKALVNYATIEMGIGILKVFQAEFGKSTVYDQWANNIESNVDRVNEAIKSSVNSMTQLSQVKPSNQIASSGNWWLEMGENALGLVGMDSRSQLDKAVKKENEKRAKEGKAPVSQAEIQSAIDTRNNINRSQLGGGTRQRDKAIVTREKLSRMRDENFYNPIQRVMEQYKFSNAGPLAEIEQLDKKIKGLKAQQAVLDPADVETAQKLTKEIGLAEKAKQDLLGPLDAQEAGLRQSLKDDQELLDKYNQAIIDQNSDDKEKRKAAEEFLRQPGHDPQSMEQVSRDIDQTTTALNNYQREQARSGAVNDTKKLAMAMMELGIAFSSVEKRMNAIHIGKLKGIAQLRLNGFSSDRFNDVNTGVATAEENYNNTQRQLAGRKETMQRLEADLAKNPSKTAADQLIAAEEEKRGRKLTGEEINMLSEIYAKEGQEQLKQAMMAEAALREERMKTADMEKQSVEEQYAIREARQARYLAIYEDAMDEMKQLDQRALSAGLQGANNELIRNLQTDLGADDKFNIKAGEIQFANIQKQIQNIPVAMQSLKQAYEQGDLSLEQYTTKSRALLTEEAQLKQQLVEQELANIRTVAQARMNELQRIKEERDANTEIANSGRTEAITKNSISKFRTDEFLTNNESLAQAKNGLVEIQNQLKNTNSELSELEEAYASGDLLLNDYIQKKRQLLITQAQQESQLATAEMARMRAIEDYRLAMLDRMRDVSNNKNAILNAEALTQLVQSQMTGQVGDSQASRQSTEIALDNAKKSVEVAKESLAEIQKAYRKKELSAEKYQERLRAINLEIAQANQSVAEQELALWKAKEQEKISILEKSLEKQDRLNKLNAIKTKINNTEQLAGMLASGGTSDLTSSIFSNQETNVSQDQLISSLTNKLAGMKEIINPTKDLQDKILATEQELNEAVLTKRLNLLSQSLEYKKQMLNATQLENKSIENQLYMIDSQHKLQQAFVEITKKRLENEIVSMERIKTLSDEIGSSSIKSVQFRSRFDDAIATKRLKTLDIELKANVRNLEIEQHREKLSQRKAENESRLAVIQAKNSLLIANQSGNSDAIALAQQQFQLANESLSAVLQQGQAMNQLHDTQKTKLSLEHQGTLQAEKYAKTQDIINSKLKTANSYLDKQKERLDSINELNKAINNARTNVLEKQTGISDRKIDLYDAINGTEKITDPKQNAVLMKELEAQLKAIGGSTDPEAMYAERLRLEESLANQKMNALVAEQNMQKTLLQIEFDKYELQAQALILQAKMLALQSKGTENEASANQILDDALKSLEQLQDRKDKAMDALGVTQETERYNQGIENANAINDARRKSAEAGYKPKGDPVKYPTATGEAGKTIKELLTGNSQRFGYAPSFDLNQAVKGLRGGNGIDIGRVNIPSPSNEPTYTPLNINEELLTPNLTENTERNTKAMYDLSNSIISLTEALVNNKPGLEINAPVANNNPVSTPTGQPTTTGGQQVINNVNYGGVTVISSDPTGDARKVLNDLAKANKNRL